MHRKAYGIHASFLALSSGTAWSIEVFRGLGVLDSVVLSSLRFIFHFYVLYETSCICVALYWARRFNR